MSDAATKAPPEMEFCFAAIIARFGMAVNKCRKRVFLCRGQILFLRNWRAILSEKHPWEENIMNGLYGVVCASITPMLPDGQVDYAGVRALCAHLVEQGIHCLYPNGTNGESLSLSAEERQRIAEIILE